MTSGIISQLTGILHIAIHYDTIQGKLVSIRCTQSVVLTGAEIKKIYLINRMKNVT